MDDAIIKLQTCLDQFQLWIENNTMKLNQSKTELIFFAPKQKLPFFSNFVLNFGGAEIHPSSVVKNLGAYFDSEMTMEKQSPISLLSDQKHLNNTEVPDKTYHPYFS